MSAEKGLLDPVKWAVISHDRDVVPVPYWNLLDKVMATRTSSGIERISRN